MRDNRRFVRVRPAGLVSKNGKIVLAGKGSAIDCSVIDLSAGGACLEVNDAAAPQEVRAVPRRHEEKLRAGVEDRPPFRRHLVTIHVHRRARKPGPARQSARLERDDFSSNRHPALGYCWSMIFSENRYPLFGITL